MDEEFVWEDPATALTANLEGGDILSSDEDIDLKRKRDELSDEDEAYANADYDPKRPRTGTGDAWDDPGDDDTGEDEPSEGEESDPDAPGNLGVPRGMGMPRGPGGAPMPSVHGYPRPFLSQATTGPPPYNSTRVHNYPSSSINGVTSSKVDLSKPGMGYPNYNSSVATYSYSPGTTSYVYPHPSPMSGAPAAPRAYSTQGHTSNTSYQPAPSNSNGNNSLGGAPLSSPNGPPSSSRALPPGYAPHSSTSGYHPLSSPSNYNTSSLSPMNYNTSQSASSPYSTAHQSYSTSPPPGNPNLSISGTGGNNNLSSSAGMGSGVMAGGLPQGNVATSSPGGGGNTVGGSDTGSSGGDGTAPIYGSTTSTNYSPVGTYSANTPPIRSVISPQYSREAYSSLPSARPLTTYSNVPSSSPSASAQGSATNTIQGGNSNYSEYPPPNGGGSGGSVGGTSAGYGITSDPNYLSYNSNEYSTLEHTGQLDYSTNNLQGSHVDNYL